MRRSRLTRYRKKHKKLILFTQVMVIFYASVVSMSLLTSSTTAYYSSASIVTGSISTASDWWDGSELEFPENATDVVHSCPRVDIAVTIKNIGEDMTKPSTYEVYYHEQKGNPEKQGESIAEGEIPILASGESIELIFEAEEEGRYQIKAYQRPGFDGVYEGRSEIWSKFVKVQCPNGNKNKEDIEKDNDKNNEEAEVQQEENSESAKEDSAEHEEANKENEQQDDQSTHEEKQEGSKEDEEDKEMEGSEEEVSAQSKPEESSKEQDKEKNEQEEDGDEQ